MFPSTDCVCCLYCALRRAFELFDGAAAVCYDDEVYYDTVVARLFWFDFSAVAESYDAAAVACTCWLLFACWYYCDWEVYYCC